MSSITCGSCKGTHSTVAEVKACYGISTERVKAAMATHPSARVVVMNHVGQARPDNTAPVEGDGIITPGGEGVDVHTWGEPMGTNSALFKFPKPGYYTIVFNEVADDRITLRVRDHWDEAGKARGEMVVDYLSGPDNTRDYVGFGFLTPRGRQNWSVWKRFRDNERLARALWGLFEDSEKAGMEYAIRSGNCYRCGRTLTVPASVHRGLGPVCAEKL